MTNYSEQVQKLLAGMDEHNEQEPETTIPESQTAGAIHDVYVLIVREQEEDQTHVVDSITTVPTHPAPATMQKDSFHSAYVFVCFSLFLILSTLVFQCYCIMNPPIATVTIMPKSQIVTLNGTMQLGRVLPPLTISQSQTTPATGKGHQIAKAATGSVTFYNGLFTQQFVASGTVYTGNDGVEIVTTHDATIPPGSPSTGYGTVTVTAQAVAAGTKGNIPAGDISITINNGLLVRNNQFSGGQNARTYTTVTQHDIHSISTELKTTIANSITGALQGQLRPQEQLEILPCSPSVSSDHQAGEEAQQVKVTVSQTCSAVAFNTQELTTKATAFLTEREQQKVGAGYSLFGTPHVRVKQASVTSTQHPLVFLSFFASGTWIYALSGAAQQQIKSLIAGMTTQQAEQLLASLPGVSRAAIRFTGLGDAARLPKTTGYIHLTIFVM